MVKRLAPRKSSSFASTAVERVVGRLGREVVELVATHVGERRAPARELEARRAQQQPVETADRDVRGPARPIDRASSHARRVAASIEGGHRRASIDLGH